MIRFQFRKLARGLLVCFTVSSVSANGQLRLGDVWQSGMVIQRDQTICLWGWTTPGASVALQLGKQSDQTTARADSTWQVCLPARPASAEPCTLVVQSGPQRILLTDLLIGDVWLCAGQSNMAFPLANDQFAPQTLHRSYNPRLRLFNRLPYLSTYNQPYRPDEIPYLQPNHFYRPAHWQVADSVSARRFSAVGYYAGALLQQELAVPIGLIHVAVGGSPAEAWMPVPTHPDQPVLKLMFTGNWLTNSALEAWCIERGHQNLDSLLHAGYPVPRDLLGYNHPFKPGFLYEAALQPIRRLGIKGILWYQGESNALSQTRARQHEQLFPLLVQSWRTAWQQENLPIYVCQLSSIGTERGYKAANWPLFRDGQRRMADSLAHVGLTVTSDVGHPWDVHPTNKKTVGERLAREVLINTYGRPWLGTPTINKIVRRQHGWRISFTQRGRRLRTADGKSLRGFAIGDSVAPLHAVPVRITRQGIELSTTHSSQATYLYYGWQSFSEGNVINADGLPLSTFRVQLP
jgi:sialate O-acetylesterase